ncbi:hypothetical protein DFH06DRAFT_1369584 [Mycena polygramma]|nr:hypothetical protein DFH06DRAFT_1369584 [Mycena polygramma]
MSPRFVFREQPLPARMRPSRSSMAHEIFSHIADFCDLLCLSMSCQVLWEIGREHLYRHVAAVVADHSWVGDRIICIGEDIQDEDIPDNMFTPAEEVEFFRYATLEDYRRQDGGEAIPKDSTQSEIAELLRTIEHRLWYYSFQHNNDQQTMFDQKTLLMPCYSRFESDRRDLKVVRDLFKTTKSALTDLTAKYPKIGLGEVVLSRICLSNEGDVRGLTYDGGIHRGVWAGDRFDIVAAEWLEEFGDDPSWADVSEEVVREMGSICEADYP